MKTSTILMAIAALGLVACSDQDEPLSVNNGNAIDFRPALGMKSRATETTNANLSAITVSSFIDNVPYFTDIDFSKANDGFFSSTDKYFWPGDETELAFYAYSPVKEDLEADVVMEPDTKQLQNFTVAEDIADQIDFITANATGTKSANEKTGVELTFDHRLAQIEIRAKSDNKQYVYKVTGARIGRPQTTGTFDFTTNEWTLDDWHETAVYDAACDEVTLSSTPVSIMGKGGNAMFIPQTLVPWSPTDDPDNVAREAYLSVLINISSVEGAVIYPFQTDKQLDANGQKRQYAWASIPLSGTWEQGKKYIYVLDFTDGAGVVDPDDPTPGLPVLGEPIKFTVNVTDWDEDTIPVDMSKYQK